MKICWDNLEKVKFTKNGFFRAKHDSYTYKESCVVCNEPYLMPNNKCNDGNGQCCSKKCGNEYRKSKYLSTLNSTIVNSKFDKLTLLKVVGKAKNRSIRVLCRCDCGKDTIVNLYSLLHGIVRSCGCLQKVHCSNLNNKGGVTKGNIALYDSFIDKLCNIEETDYFVNSEGLKVLQTTCTYCGKWFTPSMRSVTNRVSYINGKSCRESRLYCSVECKGACPIFNQNKYPKGFKRDTSREVQPELRQMVLKRDKWTCQKCEESNVELHCHHITGVEQNPIESADVDNCVTLCKKCHKEVHKNNGCRYVDLQCKK